MIEEEFGVPIPGEILPEDRWARTAIKRLPPPGPLDFGAIFGRVAPVVLELGCGNGRFTLASALARPEVDHLASDILPVVIRYATRGACTPSGSRSRTRRRSCGATSPRPGSPRSTFTTPSRITTPARRTSGW